jgi:hypothetical protein
LIRYARRFATASENEAHRLAYGRPGEAITRICITFIRATGFITALFDVDRIGRAGLAAIDVNELHGQGVLTGVSRLAAIEDCRSIAPLLVAFEARIVLHKVGKAGILFEGYFAVLGLLDDAYARERSR